MPSAISRSIAKGHQKKACSNKRPSHSSTKQVSQSNHHITRSMSSTPSSILTSKRIKRQLQRIAKAHFATAVSAQAINTKYTTEQLWEQALSNNIFIDALHAIKTRIPGFAYAEVWAPSGNDFVGKQSYLAPELLEQYSAASQDHSSRIEHGSEMSEINNVYRNKQPIVLSSIGKEHVYHKFATSPELPFKTGAIVPITHKDKIHAIVRLFSSDSVPLSAEDYQDVTQGIFSAAVYGNTVHYSKLPFKQYSEEVSLEKQQDVYMALVTNGIFPPARCFAEVDQFFKLGFAPTYFKRFDARVIANHIQAFSASKQFAEASANPEDVWLAIENNIKFMGGLPPEQSFHIVPAEPRKVFAVERNIIRRIKLIPSEKNFSLEMSSTRGPFAASTNKRACMYILNTHEYAHPEYIGNEQVSQLELISTKHFLQNKSKLVLERYQEVVKEAANSLSPITRVYPEHHRDGSIPVFMAFKAQEHQGPHSNYMLQLTQLLNNNKLTANRKFIETFANNVVVMSLYIDPQNGVQKPIEQLTKQFAMLSLVPQSDVLTPHFLSGSLSAEEYTYLSAASKLLYYVISSRPDEYNMLSKHLEKDQLNMGRLRNLYTSIRREAVSHSRIQKTMLKYPDIAKLVYNDFEHRTTTDQLNGKGVIPPNEELSSLIKKNVIGGMEGQIFQSMLLFNQCVPKTNFYRQDKSAISFRIEPQFFADMDLPRLPYGVFFILGAQFQGFHIRFADVARGGIRLIRSRDDANYNKNVATQFHENFNLAFTQNLKNKDIPEFGSKGTVLLNPDCQNQGIISFQRFVSSILDLTCDNEHAKPGDPHYFVNNYGKPEILFLGPDEGTAGVMSWAALYAKSRGFAFWRAFTTGKPPQLGGIPHDTYGMTTNSVHRYVVGCIEKLGLKEESCTKVQTGGPDGDLGSNEILMSKDRTIAVVDGSGVIFDPVGLDRQELTRLAKLRIMVDNFDKTKLGPKGFYVGINDKDVTLPDGERIDSGFQFRNDFHLTKYSQADLFVPCGGRPESVNLSNVKKLFDPKTGQPKFKVIVEGANLFITQDARLVLEEAGVILYKDASSNKGGVTSSSLEVLAALSLDDTTFENNMACHDPSRPPEAYKEYVKEIQERITADAGHEFECIWREHLRTGLPRFILTDKISNKINTLNDYIHDSDLWANNSLRKVVLQEALPRKLQDLAGFESLIATAPESYLKAIFSAYLSSRYVYKYGIDANEFAFYSFMEPYTKKALLLEGEAK